MIIPFVTLVLSAWLDNERVGVGLVLGGSWSWSASTSEHYVPPKSPKTMWMRKMTCQPSRCSPCFGYDSE